MLRHWTLAVVGCWVSAAAACVDLDALTVASSDASEGDGGGPPDAHGDERGADAYDTTVLADRPLGFWAMASAEANEPDLSGRGHVGTYQGGRPTRATLPNGAAAATFDGTMQSMVVETSPDFSIATRGQMTWEAWIRPDTLTFPKAIDGEYVHWIGKCASYAPSCEWQGRFYVGGRAISALAFNNGGGSGSGAEWQPAPDLLRAGQWLHVVAEYQTQSTPPDCKATPRGSVDIWVNGVRWDAASHRPRGCLSDANIVPTAANSPLVVGSVAFDSFFAGAIGKVAIYDTLLTQERIAAHFRAMTGADVSGSCGASCTIPVPTQSR